MKRIALYAQIVEPKNGYAHLNFKVVTIDAENKIRNFRWEYDDNENTFYDDLNIVCQMDEKEPTRTYGWGIDYIETYSIGLDRAEKMVKTLKKIHKKIDKMNEELGIPETYGEFVARIAKIITAKEIIFCTTHKGWSYDENEHKFVDLQFARKYINNEIEKLSEKF